MGEKTEDKGEESDGATSPSVPQSQRDKVEHTHWFAICQQSREDSGPEKAQLRVLPLFLSN